MTYLHIPDGKHLVSDGIGNPVSTLTNTVSFSPGRFFMTRRPSAFCERLYAVDNVLERFLWYRAEVFLNGFSEIDAISGHLFSIS